MRTIWTGYRNSVVRFNIHPGDFYQMATCECGWTGPKHYNDLTHLCIENIMSHSCNLPSIQRGDIVEFTFDGNVQFAQVDEVMDEAFSARILNSELMVILPINGIYRQWTESQYYELF